MVILIEQLILLSLDLKDLVLHFDHVMFNHIPKSMNKQAHALTKLCFSLEQDILIWIGLL